MNSDKDKIPDKSGRGYWTHNKFNQPMYVSYGQSTSEGRVKKSKNRIDDANLTDMLGGI